MEQKDIDRIELFLARVNKVTSNHRHGQPISKRALDNLSNSQLDMESWLRDLKNKNKEELERIEQAFDKCSKIVDDISI